MTLIGKTIKNEECYSDDYSQHNFLTTTDDEIFYLYQEDDYEQYEFFKQISLFEKKDILKQHKLLVKSERPKKKDETRKRSSSVPCDTENVGIFCSKKVKKDEFSPKDIFEGIMSMSMNTNKQINQVIVID
jgi:hypothetical protein